MAKKEVAKKDDNALMLGDIDVGELVADAEKYEHGFSRTDLVIPFIRILQKLSPQLDKTEGVFIEGAEEGDFLNLATGNTINGAEGFHFVPAIYTINYMEWRTRESGGGIVADHGTDANVLKNTSRDEKNRMMTPDGNVIVTSGLYFGFLVDIATGQAQQAIVPMASTQLKKSRQMNSTIDSLRQEITVDGQKRRIKPPMWFSIFKMTTVPESNDQGKWMGYKVERVGSILEHDWGAECYKACRDLKEMFDKGDVKMRAEDMDGDTGQGDGSGGAGPGAGGDKDDDIPF